MSDFFGYNRTVGASNQIATSEALIITGLGGRDLIQSVSISYGQNVRTLFAVGNSNVYFVGGQAMGSMDFERLSACGAILQGIDGSNCGKLGNISISGGSSNCFCAPGGATISDAILQNVSIRVQAGQTEIFEGGRIQFATFSTSG